MLMMLLDRALDPEEFLKERVFLGYPITVSVDLECQVYFYWGARELTEGNYSDAVKPLALAIGRKCQALERRLAEADLRIAIARV